MGTGGIEREGVPDDAGNSVQCTVRQRECHEGIIRAGERGMDPKVPCNGEPELRVIRGVADNDHDPVPEALAFLETLFDKGCTDPEALEVLVHREGGKCERRRLCRIRDDGNGGNRICPIIRSPDSATSESSQS